MFEQNYKSAMEKVTPSEKWRGDTLEKMKQAQKEKASGAENINAVNGGANTAEKKIIRTNKGFFSVKSRRNIIAAAAIALIALPAMYVMFMVSTPMMSDSAAPEAAAEAAEEAVPRDAVAGLETEQYAIDDAITQETTAGQGQTQGADTAQAAPKDAAADGGLPEESYEEERAQSPESTIIMNGTITQMDNAQFTLTDDTGAEYICEHTADTLWLFDGDALQMQVEMVCVISENGEYIALEVWAAA